MKSNSSIEELRNMTIDDLLFYAEGFREVDEALKKRAEKK